MPQFFSRTGAAVLLLAVMTSSCAYADFFNGTFNDDNRARSTPMPLPEQRNNVAVDDSPRPYPSLVVTDSPPPAVIYRRGSHDTVLANPDSGTGTRITSLADQRMETPVTRKAMELSRELNASSKNNGMVMKRFNTLQSNSDAQLASYYTIVASINAALQTGTTIGNPILVDRWSNAQEKLNEISQDTSLLNSLAMDLSDQASRQAFLLESTRAAFALSGAVDEDHKRLTEIEDRINQNIITTNRTMNMVNAALARRAAYLRTERANLQALSLAIGSGELHGKSLTNGVFDKALDGNVDSNTARPPLPAGEVRRPLVIIRFNSPNVNYDQPLYTAISQALEKYPLSKFDVVAVNSSKGNPAETALSASEARKNGEAVLRSLTQMGLPTERISLRTGDSRDIMNSEVQIYIR